MKEHHLHKFCLFSLKKEIVYTIWTWIASAKLITVAHEAAVYESKWKPGLPFYHLQLCTYLFNEKTATGREEHEKEKKKIRETCYFTFTLYLAIIDNWYTGSTFISNQIEMLIPMSFLHILMMQPEQLNMIAFEAYYVFTFSLIILHLSLTLFVLLPF